METLQIIKIVLKKHYNNLLIKYAKTPPQSMSNYINFKIVHYKICKLQHYIAKMK